MDYTTKEVIHIFRAFGLASSQQSVRRQIKNGQLPAITRHTGKRGGVHYVIPQQSIEQYLAHQIPLYPIIKQTMPTLLDIAIKGEEL